MLENFAYLLEGSHVIILLLEFLSLLTDSRIKLQPQNSRNLICQKPYFLTQLMEEIIIHRLFCFHISTDYTTGKLILFLAGKFAITIAFTVVYVFTAELFPTELRHSMLGACSMVGRIGSIIAPQTPLLVSTLFVLFTFIRMVFSDNCKIKLSVNHTVSQDRLPFYGFIQLRVCECVLFTLSHLQYFKIPVRNILCSKIFWTNFNTLTLPFLKVKNKY
jgi:hypothetical protein